MLSLFFDSPTIFFLVAFVFVFSLSVHEFAHALVADKLGDPTPRFAGRITLNPIAHLDLFGTLMILFTRIGWGKPVPINPANFVHPRKDAALVALAGPFSNIVLAIVFAVLVHLLNFSRAMDAFMYMLISFNLGLAFFNLLPVFPLDGFNIVNGLLPFHLAYQWDQTRNYGIIILLFLILTGTTGYFIFPAIDFSLKLLGF